MSEQMLLQLVSETVKLSLLLSTPLLIVALVVGVGISVLQVVTSIQDATLSFVPRIVAIIIVGYLLLPWMAEKLTTFTIRLFSQFALYAS